MSIQEMIHAGYKKLEVLCKSEKIISVCGIFLKEKYESKIKGDKNGSKIS